MNFGGWFALTAMMLSPCLMSAQNPEPTIKGRALSEWIADLKSERAPTREKAALTIGDLGPKAEAAVPALIESLKDGEPTVRANSAYALHHIGGPAKAAVPALIKNLKDADEQARRWAAIALGKIGADAERAVPALGKALGDQSETVRFAAAQAIVGFGADAKLAVSDIAAALADKSPAIRRELLTALGNAGPDAKKAVDAVAGLLMDKDAGIRKSALAVLEKFGRDAKSATAAIAESLGQDDLLFRLRAIALLHTVDPKHAAILPALRNSLKEPDSVGRIRAIHLLARIDPEATVPATTLVEMTIDRSVQVREWAGLRIKAIGENAVPALTEAFVHKDAAVRRAAARHLAILGPKAKAAIPTLAKALTDSDTEQRIRAAETLLAIDGSAKEPMVALVQLLGDKNEKHRQLAGDALVCLGHGATPAIPLLAENLKSLELSCRLSTIATLNRLARIAEPAAPALIETLKDQDTAVRAAALEALFRIRPDPKDTAAPLREIVSKASGEFKVQVASLLFEITRKADEAVPVFLEAVRSKDTGLRKLGSDALWKLRIDAKEIVPQLIELAKDKDPDVRMAAMNVLQHLGPAAKPATAAILESLKDGSSAHRSQALTTLGSIRPDAQAVCPVLKEYLDHKEVRFRVRCASLMFELDPNAVEAADAILANLANGDAQTHSAVLSALRRWGPAHKKVAPQLFKQLKTAKNLELIEEIIATLERMRLPVKEFAPALLDCWPTPFMEANTKIRFAIRRFGPEASAAVPGLVALLKEDAENHHSAALTILDAMGPAGKEAIEPVAAMLKNYGTKGGRIATVRHAGRTLGSLGPDAIKPLTQLLTDASPIVRQAACEGFIELGPEAASAVPDLIAALNDESEEVRAAVTTALGRIGEKAVPALVKALDHKDARVRMEALRSFAKSDADTRLLKGDCAKLLKDQVADVRAAAAQVLLELDSETEPLLPFLLEGLKAEKPADRRSAIASLLTMQPNSKEMVKPLTIALRDSDALVRIRAARCLWEASRDGELVVPTLLEVLRGNESSGVRSEAAAALGTIGSEAMEAVPALLAIVATSKDSVSQQSTRALIRMGPRAVDGLFALIQPVNREAANRILNLVGFYGGIELLEPLSQLRPQDAELDGKVFGAIQDIASRNFAGGVYLAPGLTNPDEKTRQWTLSFLSRMPWEAKELVPELVDALPRASVAQRRQIMHLFAELGPDAREAIPAIRRMMGDPEPAVHSAAAEALWRIDPDNLDTFPVLAHSLRQFRAFHVQFATRALEAMGPKARAQAKTLQEFLEKGHDDDGASNAAIALAAIGADFKTAGPALMEVFRRPNQVLWRRAAEAIGKYGVGAKEAIPLLMACMREAKSGVDRAEFLEPLAMIAPANDGDVVRFLEEALHDEDWDVRVTAAGVLLNVSPGHKAVIPILRSAMYLTSVPIREKAARISGRLGADGKELTGALAMMLRDSQLNLRIAAAQALWQIEGEKANRRLVPILIVGVENLRSSGTAISACAVLKQMGSHGKTAVPALLEAHKAKNPQVREAAAAALKAVDPEVARKVGIN